ATQLERAPARRFLLERGAALLDGARLFARLRGRPMQRAFAGRLGLRRRRRGRRFRRGCRGFRRLRLAAFGCQFGGGLLRFLFLLRLALRGLRLLLLDLFLLARDELLALLFLRRTGGELFRRDQRHRSNRRRRFLDRWRGVLVALHEDAPLAHFDLDRPRRSARY